MHLRDEAEVQEAQKILHTIRKGLLWIAAIGLIIIFLAEVLGGSGGKIRLWLSDLLENSGSEDECWETISLVAQTDDFSEKQALPSGSKNGCAFNIAWNGRVTFQFGEKNKYNPLKEAPEWDGVTVQWMNEKELDFVEFECKFVDFHLLEFNKRYARFPRGVKARSCEKEPVTIEFKFTGEVS